MPSLKNDVKSCLLILQVWNVKAPKFEKHCNITGYEKYFKSDRFVLNSTEVLNRIFNPYLYYIVSKPPDV